MSRVVGVGAGVGGLAVAARLACLGHQVTVLEAADTVGGKLGFLERDGFRFDTGPSLLTMPAVFEDLFAATGGWPAGLALQRLDPIARYRFADGTGFDATDDLDELCRRLDVALGVGAGDDWRAFLVRARRIWKASRTPFLESALHGSRSLAALTLKHPGDLATLAPGRSLRDLGRRHLRDPRLRMVLDRYARDAQRPGAVPPTSRRGRGAEHPAGARVRHARPGPLAAIGPPAARHAGHLA